MKKAVALILAAFLTLSLLAACGGGPAPEPEKTTTGFDSFEITYFWGPQGDSFLTDKWYWEAAVECGFTSVPIECFSAATNKTVLGLFKECGLTCSALYDSRIVRLLSRNYSDEEIEKAVKEVVDDYAEYADIIKGWYLKDEPAANLFAKLGKVVAAFKKVDPERPVLIDLFPNYAIPQVHLKTADYQEYVDRFIEETAPQYLCYDHYNFKRDGTSREGYFTNFEIIRKAALDAGIDYMMIDLLTDLAGNYADVTRAQLLWESNMALCYGAKRISHFTYFVSQAYTETYGWTNACVDDRHEKFPHFEDAKAVHALVLPLGRELFNKRSEAVFHLTGDPASLEEGCAAYESYGKLGKVTGDEFVIGFFSDGSFMIMNKHWEEGAEGNNALIFDDVASGLEYFDVESASWKAYNNKNESGKYVYNAKAGEGLLFRVK